MQIKRKPEWLKVRLPNTAEFKHVKHTLTSYRLHSVCQEARCPNMTECFHAGTATFLILGDTCTRNCRYCNVEHGKPVGLDESEPERLVQAVKELDLSYIVITSVTRDDLPDGGAEIYARCISLLKQQVPECKVEVLIPDFQGDWDALDIVLQAGPDVLNHNMEVTRSMFSQLRPKGNYQTSLALLERVSKGKNTEDAKETQSTQRKITVPKSGFMVGVGESQDDIIDLMQDLRQVDCQRLTIGQYLQPTREHWPIVKYYRPEEFEELKEIGYELGFEFVESGPLVRSSYHAAQASS